MPKHVHEGSRGKPTEDNFVLFLAVHDLACRTSCLTRETKRGNEDFTRAESNSP